MVEFGIPVGFVAGCLRVQLVPTIKLSVVGDDVTIQRRTRGGMTGTQCAGPDTDIMFDTEARASLERLGARDTRRCVDIVSIH